MLNVSIKTKPITMPFKIIRVPFFYVSGSHFRISALITNLSSQTIQGGELHITISYAFGNFFERMIGYVGVIRPQEGVIVDFLGNVKWGVEANGHAIFLALFYDNTKNLIPLCDEKSRPLGLQVDRVRNPLGYHVHTFHALTVGELYTLMALTVNSFAFIINIFMTALVNGEKLIENWNFFLNYQLILAIPTTIILSLVIIAIVLWLIFVYVLYDRYGLYKRP